MKNYILHKNEIQVQFAVLPNNEVSIQYVIDGERKKPWTGHIEIARDSYVNLLDRGFKE